MVEEPAWPPAGVIVMVRVPPLPPKTMLPEGTSVGFDDVAESVRLPAAVCASLTAKLTGPIGTPAVVVLSVMFAMLGGVLTGGGGGVVSPASCVTSPAVSTRL